jgi:hypothetical protein
MQMSLNIRYVTYSTGHYSYFLKLKGSIRNSVRGGTVCWNVDSRIATGFELLLKNVVFTNLFNRDANSYY